MPLDELLNLREEHSTLKINIKNDIANNKFKCFFIYGGANEKEIICHCDILIMFNNIYKLVLNDHCDNKMIEFIRYNLDKQDKLTIGTYLFNAIQKEINQQSIKKECDKTSNIGALFGIAFNSFSLTFIKKGSSFETMRNDVDEEFLLLTSIPDI